MERFRRRISVLVLLGVLISLAGMSRSYAASEAGPRAEKIVMDSYYKGNDYKENYFTLKDFNIDYDEKDPFAEFILEGQGIDQESFKKIDRIRFKNKDGSEEAVIRLNKEYDYKILNKEIEIENPDEGEKDKIEEIYNQGFLAYDEDSGKLKGRMGEEAKKVLSYGHDFDSDDNSRTAAGDYEIFVDYSGSRKSERISLDIKFKDEPENYDHIKIRSKPRVISTSPRDGERYVNFYQFYRRSRDGEKTYYLEVRFEDFGRELDLIEKDIPGNMISIRGIGSDLGNMASSKKLLEYDRARATLYIPLEDKLDEKVEYQVFIPEDLILENKIFGRKSSEDNKEENKLESVLGNKAYNWKFTTNYKVIPEYVYEGSVVEDYDVNYPILIKGKDFTYFTRVYFVDEGGYYHRPDKLLRYYDGDEEYLKIYLPRYRKLPVGDYKIIFTNEDEFESQLEFGSFSVVASGNESFEDGSYINEKGEILLSSSSKESLDVFDLSENKSWVIDLDTLAGNNSWSKKIEGNRRSNLKLKSASYTFDFKGLNTADFTVGKASPVIRDKILKDLKGREILGEIIEIHGDDLEFEKVELSMDYKGGKADRILRYDEFNREYEVIEDFSFSEEDNIVTINSNEKGIFIVLR